MKLAALAFDLDNTLINFMLFKRKTAAAAASAMVEQGLPLSKEEAEERIFEIYSKKGIEYQKTFYDLISPFHLPLNKAERIQQAGILAYLKTKFAVLHPYPDVPQTLHELRFKYKLAVVTDAPRNKAWQRLLLTNLAGYFDTVITFHDTNAHKPSQEPFQKLVSALALEPKQILFTGDNAARDIKGAKEAGMRTCLAKYGAIIGFDSSVQPDFEIERFSDLLGIAMNLD